MSLHIPSPGVTIEAHTAGLIYAAEAKLRAAQLCMAHASRPGEFRPMIEDVGAHAEALITLAIAIRFYGAGGPGK